MAQASAAFIMKRRVKGTPQQLAKDAARLMSRSSGLAGNVAPDDPRAMGMSPPRPGSILEENESVQHEALNLSSQSGQAQQDANVIRAPISAAERFSQAYFGDASNSNLATATSLELPILKAVETRQEVFEGIFRWFIDRVIEKAVDDGRLDRELSAEELADVARQGPTPADFGQNGQPAEQEALRAALIEAAADEARQGRELLDVARVRAQGQRDVWMVATRGADERTHYRLVEAHEEKAEDEADTMRDLSYDFSMPSPLRRMMSDLIGAIVQIAQTFDPNNTNPELSRALLTIALGEGLEIQDPADICSTRSSRRATSTRC